MSSHPPAIAPAYVALKAAFTDVELDRIVRHGDGLQHQPATLADQAQDDQAEKLRVTETAFIDNTAETRWLYARLEGIVHAANTQVYGFDLSGLYEQFQYTVYRGAEGSHYNWHVDQAAALTPRKLSLSVQLSDPAEYEGCDLQLHGGDRIEIAPRDRGCVIIFPSYVLHRVTPIASGTRKSLVVWVSGAKFR